MGTLYAECVRASGLHPSCDRFFEIFLPTLRRIAFRVAAQFSAQQETEDVIQEINLKLARKDRSILSSLPMEPPLSLAYFSVYAANAARDFFRARNAIKRGFDRTVAINEALADITKGLPNQPERAILLAQIDDLLPDDEKVRMIFRLYYRQGFTAREIAAIPEVGLSVKGVESLIDRTVKGVRQKLAPTPVKTTPVGGNAGQNPS